MTLNLTITNPNADYGRYYCVSKNEVGITRGEIDVYGNYVLYGCGPSPSAASLRFFIRFR